MFKGKFVKLRRLEVADVDTILPHWNDYDMRQYLATPLPNNRKDLVDYIEAADEAFNGRSRFVFGVEYLSDDKLIGIVTLENISWLSSHASLDRLVIFNRDYLGKGCGKDAMIVMLDFAFNVLDLHVVYLWVEAFNEHAVRLYERLGFSNRGTLRELAFRNGERWDVAVMDILKSEYIEKFGVLPKI